MVKVHKVYLRIGGEASFANVVLQDYFQEYKNSNIWAICSGIIYASLQPTEKGRSIISSAEPVLLPRVSTTDNIRCENIKNESEPFDEIYRMSKKRCGKGNTCYPYSKNFY